MLQAPFFKNMTKVNLVASYALLTMKNGKFEAIPLYYYQFSDAFDSLLISQPKLNQISKNMSGLKSS